MKRDLSRLQKTVSSSSAGEIDIIPAAKAKSSGRRKTVKNKDAIALNPLADVLEDSVKKEVQIIIDLYRLAIKRQNVGAMKIKKRFIKFGEKGDLDFAGYCKYTGRYVAIETKRPVGGIVSNAQRRKLDAINEAGGVGIIAISGADCLAQLIEAEVIR